MEKPCFLNKEINCIILPPAAEELGSGQTKPIIKRRLFVIMLI
jgi:hypothetical protein